MYTINQLKSIRQCPLKGYLSQFNYKTEQTKYLHLLGLYKTAIKENATNYSEFFDNNIDDKFYILDYNKNIDKNIFVKHLNRFRQYMNNEGLTIYKTDVSGYVDILGDSIYVKADLVLKSGSVFTLAKISQSKPKLSYNATSDKNKPKNNLELYLLDRLGKQLYKDKKVCSALFHLNGKYDEKDDYSKFLNEQTDELIDELHGLEKKRESYLADVKKREANKCNTLIKKLKGVLYFEGSKGSHVITTDEFDIDYIHNELREIFNTEASIDSKPCKSNDCDKCNNQVLCMAKRFNKVDLEVVEEVKKEQKKDFGLTKAQQEYVDFKEGYARINSVAGSGKTFTSVKRVIEMLDEVNPSELLLITFTNAGVEEYGNKISKMSSIDKRSLNIFTFNSFGMSLIEKEYKRLGYTKQPEIINRIDKVELIKDIVNNSRKFDWLNYKHPLLNLPTSQGAVYQLMSLFDEIKSFGLDECEEDYNSKMALYNKYNQRLKDINKIDYEDQVVLAIEILKDEKLLNKYGFSHIVVDEMQDTNLRQIQLLQILDKYYKIKSMVFVGDDYQSIYKFRGCDPYYMINIRNYFKDTKDIFMVDNFRSTPEICDVCNKFISNNIDRIEKDMIPNKPNGDKAILLEYNTKDEEYSSIAEDIKYKIESGINPQDIAILGRQSKELLEIQTLLSQSSIPNRLATPQLHMNNHNIRLIINLTKYMLNKENDLYLFEYILGTTSYLDNEIDKSEIDKKVNEIKLNLEKLEDEFENQFDFFMHLTERARKEDKVCRDFVDSVRLEKQWNTFYDFSIHLQKYVSYNDNSQSDKDETKYKAITLTSMHSSKGLEWDIVYVLLDKLDYDEKDISNLEEERRLTYVAMSRAKEKLIMTYNTSQDKKRGAGKYSKMIDEIREVLNG